MQCPVSGSPAGCAPVPFAVTVRISRGVSLDRIAALAVLAVLSACADRIAHEPARQPLIGGQEVPSAAFPTVVGLEYGPGDWDCTGTLVDPEWVLTAAHCVEGVAADELAVRFDAEDLTTGTDGTAVAVDEVHAHPQFVDHIWDHDIALLRLGAPMAGRPVTPIHRQPVPPGTTAVQVGYGDSDDEGNGGGHLRMLESESVDCAETGDPEIAPGRLLCFDGRDGAAACSGDSGGPAFVERGDRLEVAGVNSGGTSDLCTRGWDLNTLVAAELAYIDELLPAASGDQGDAGAEPGPGADGGSDPGPDHRPEPSATGGGCSPAAGRAGGSCAAAIAWFALALARRGRGGARGSRRRGSAPRDTSREPSPGHLAATRARRRSRASTRVGWQR